MYSVLLFCFHEYHCAGIFFFKTVFFSNLILSRNLLKYRCEWYHKAPQQRPLLTWRLRMRRNALTSQPPGSGTSDAIENVAIEIRTHVISWWRTAYSKTNDTPKSHENLPCHPFHLSFGRQVFERMTSWLKSHPVAKFFKYQLLSRKKKILPVSNEAFCKASASGLGGTCL